MPLLVWRYAYSCRHLPLYYSGSFRSCVQCSFQMHEEEASWVSQSSWIHARHLPGTSLFWKHLSYLWYDFMWVCLKSVCLFPEQIPKVAATCNFQAIMDGYYGILFPLNPGSIRPTMPSGCEHEALIRPHNRESLSSVDQSMAVHVSWGCLPIHYTCKSVSCICM